MTLEGARVALSATQASYFNVGIARGRILPFENRTEHRLRLDLSGYLLLPGLINSHDHLEFNLFPRLGRGPHANYVEWAASVFHPDRAPLKEHLRVPKPTRLVWGALKNLLSGVTSVAHHNPYEAHVFNTEFPVRVVKRFGWAHSLHFSPNVAALCQRTPPNWPFLIHAAEGTDSLARSEIASLYQANVLSNRTVLIHAVALDGRSVDLLRQCQTSLIWCPSSNAFTIGRTLDADVLRSELPISLGTDSALTGQGDLIDELRIAKSHAKLTANQLFDMVTTVAAKMLRLESGEGTIREGGIADVVAIADPQGTPAAALHAMHPELVVVEGKIKLVSERLAARIPSPLKRGLEPIRVEGRGDYLVKAKVSQLHAATSKILGSSFKLAGRAVHA
jgi:cytosine/adenosine deaminase-related metal-dependent hydrolase